ncbi:thymine dioxygenase [Suillus subaureus]|uniref:Thymine dioxygenase n=1 Tax=Suillus subaureus TaxID=48587 RepID=A0A9P7ECD5_9AGAM|nr:thymine dioxygenase [Suillus subaureus]KAG1817133.1 thymine dioxygenase [Suillus subaureus]
MSSHPIPIIDFAPFLDGSAKQQVADQLLGSFKSAGFVYLTNFGLSNEEVQEMFDWSKRFFALPHESKMLAPHPGSGMHHRGYSFPGQEKETQLPDSGDSAAEAEVPIPSVKESFDIGREEDDLMPNIWPPDHILPGFKESCLAFYWKCYEVEKNILRALALGFGLEEEWFVRYHGMPDNGLRLQHYPSIALESVLTNKVARIATHTDFDTLTVLFPDSVGSLEIEDPNESGRFLAVSPIPNSIIVNAGDFLRRCEGSFGLAGTIYSYQCVDLTSVGSNDIIRSTMHRVRAPPNPVTKDGMLPDRYSIPYFCAADFSTVVDPIPGTWSADYPKKYEPVSVKEYVMKRFAADY